MMKTLTDLQKENTNLRRQAADYEREKLEKKHEENEKINSLLCEISTLKRYIEKNEALKLSHSIETQNIRAETTKLKQELNDKDETIKEVKNAFDVSKLQLLEEKNEKENIIIKMNEELRQKDLMKEELSKAKNNIELNKQKNKYFEKELEKIRGIIQEKEEKIEDIKEIVNKKEKDKKRLENEVEQHQREIHALHAEMKTLQEKLEKSLTNEKTIEKQLYNLTLEKKSYMENMNEKLKLSRDEIGMMKRKNQNLKALLDDNNNIEKDFEEMKKLNEKLKKSLSTECDQNKETKDELGNKKKEIETLTEKLSRAERNENCMKKEIETWKSKINQNKIELQEEVIKKEKLKNHFQEKDFMIKKLEKELKDKNLVMVSCVDEKENMKKMMEKKEKNYTIKFETLEKCLKIKEEKNSKTLKELQEKLIYSQKREATLTEILKAKEEEIIRISKETLENGAIFSTQKFDLSMYQEQNTTLLQHLGKSQKQVEILQHQISVLKKHFEDTKNKKQKLESCFERLNKQLILRTQQLNDTVKSYIGMKSQLDCCRQNQTLNSEQLRACQLKLQQAFLLEASLQQNVSDLNKELADTRAKQKFFEDILSNDDHLTM